jgi:hypothetical protein
LPYRFLSGKTVSTKWGHVLISGHTLATAKRMAKTGTKIKMVKDGRVLPT